MTDTVLEDFLRESRNHAGGKPSESLQQVTRAFFQRASSDPAILRAAAESLPTLPPGGAEWLAGVFGAAVTNGYDAALTTPALVQCLRSWLPRLPVPEIAQDEEGEEFDSFPDPTAEQEKLIEALRPLGQSIVAHLARMPGERQKLADDMELLERLEELDGYSPGTRWVREALLRTSGTLIVLHPPTRAGFKLRYENVATNFHLFSLLQAAVGTRIPGGRKAKPKIAAAARGETSDNVNDEAWWHYGDPRSKRPELEESIWGEGLVTDIPLINGARVMLLWPPIMQSRSWDAGFFAPHLQALPANVFFEEELSRESSREWFEALGL